MIDKSTWKSGRIKDICERGSSNLSLKVIEDNEGEYPIYGASGLIKYVDFYHQESEYIGLVKDGAGVGRVQYLPAYSSIIGTLQYIIPKANYPVKFIGYYLQSLKLERFATGATIPHIYFRDYGECKIKIPPLPTQHQIVSELDTLNSIIDKKKEQLNELDNLAQATFYDMFGDPVENEKGWEVKKIKDIGRVRIGPFGSLLHVADYIEGGTPIVNPVHMINEAIEPDVKLTVSDDKKIELENYILKENDIVLARRGDIGRCARVTSVEEGYLCGTGSMFVRFSSKINSVFAIKTFVSVPMVDNLTSKAKGATMLNINAGIVNDLLFIVPPLLLQTQFAEKIKHIEQQKALIQRSINNVQQLFDYTMDKYFNSK